MSVSTQELIISLVYEYWIAEQQLSNIKKLNSDNEPKMGNMSTMFYDIIRHSCSIPNSHQYSSSFFYKELQQNVSENIATLTLNSIRNETRPFFREFFLFELQHDNMIEQYNNFMTDNLKYQIKHSFLAYRELKR